jgi:hypothetical protein
MSERIDGFRPDLGVEAVERPGVPRPLLPVTRGDDLTGGRIRDRLDELFPDSHVERRLRDFAEPRLRDPAILVPRRFESLLEGALAALRAHPGGEPSPAAAALERLLTEEMDLRAQLRTMRSALLKA